MGEINRYFNREFKINAVQLVTEKRMSVRKVADELNIHPNLLSIWKGKYLKEGEKAFSGRGRISPEKTELRKLRKELEHQSSKSIQVTTQMRKMILCKISC